MLFSEPKIPQMHRRRPSCLSTDSFSALQRAENSSNNKTAQANISPERFQCSSASRKFLKPFARACKHYRSSFSALQRAENSSNDRSLPGHIIATSFSALQRAENSSNRVSTSTSIFFQGFSALQRAENSSNPTLAPASIHIPDCDDHASSFLSLPGASP